MALALAVATPALAQQPEGVPVHAAHNPILSDGQFYSTDPAPIVVGDTLYILTGRDEAAPDVNDFIMNEWQMLATKNVASGDWVHYRHFLRPEQVFKWAEPGRAYAGQVIQGPDKRFYLYAPVLEANSKNDDGFAIGVAVSNTPLGPWTDAHPAGPIVSQSVPEANTIQNIDPTPFVDDDGRVYLYWGTFGQLRAMELNPDMVTPKGAEITGFEIKVGGLTGFFEAPWLFKRKGTYYLAYAGNNAGPDSPCTQAVYHACIAYGSAPSPLGPWTYRGVILPPVSSTTSHPGIIEFKGKWYIAYHTADAKGGGHFRRSVAIDEVHWDDSLSSAAILPVTPTPEPPSVIGPQRNIAPAARSTASNWPVPVQYAIAALNDGIVRANPLPPDMWGSWSAHNPPRQWVEYQWDKAVTLGAARVRFWSDHPAGSGEGVAVPAKWHLEAWTGEAWRPVKAGSAYGTAPDVFNAVTFKPVTTRCLRAVFDASSDGTTYAAVAVQEWEALAPRPAKVTIATGHRPASPDCAAE